MLKIYGIILGLFGLLSGCKWLGAISFLSWTTVGFLFTACILVVTLLSFLGD
jgi:hypothetical protein